ncbi:signal recognition particle 9 kDa protein-like, partial [Vespula maculifrons]
KFIDLGDARRRCLSSTLTSSLEYVRKIQSSSSLKRVLFQPMTYLNSWEEFEKGAERLYLQNPMKARYSMKYCHNKGVLWLKLTDNCTCLQYKTEIAQDLKKMEKFIGNLMRHMASKDS